jgi:hypothetical protein
MNTILMLQLTLSLLNAAAGHTIDRQAINALVAQSVEIAQGQQQITVASNLDCNDLIAAEQCSVIPLASNGSVAPTSTVAAPARIFIPTGAAYSVFNQPQY